jgi:hypothetical protein
MSARTGNFCRIQEGFSCKSILMQDANTTGPAPGLMELVFLQVKHIFSDINEVNESMVKNEYNLKKKAVI